ncbi:MAG: hypothetical protein DRN37_10195 [Thermoplasmata archaeon]|nr:MAG: hypothetical protein DRN37_10195 [Thermoplasmata archaeon]
MSVIFRALEKLKGPSGRKEAKASRSGKRPGVYAFQKVIFSPAGVLFLAIIAVGAILIALYGIKQMTDVVPPVKQPPNILNEEHYPDAPDGQTVPPDTPSPRQPAMDQEIPAPPARISFKPAKPGKLLLPQSGKKEKRADEQDIPARYLPPGTGPGASQDKPRPEEAIPSQIPKTQKIWAMARGRKEGRPKPLSERGGDDLPARATETKEGNLFPEVEGDIYQEQGGGAELERGRGTAAITTGRRALLTTGPTKIKTPAVTGRVPENVEGMESEKIKVADTDKSARICRLVSRIQRAIDAGDRAEVDALIEQLATLKGEGNKYVLKLRAFWHIKQEEYDSASSLLTSLLQMDENDLDAGINMAVLEIRMQKLDQARRRLLRLRHIYQDNTLIQGLLQQIGR